MPHRTVKIPDELKTHRQWVNWKTIERGGKQTKIPIQPNGHPAKSTDATTWSNFDDLANGLIGFVFDPNDPYIGIDLDGCRNPETGQLDGWAFEIVERFATYTEVSPSGTGVKMFGVTDAQWRHNNKVELGGDGYRSKKPGIEVYDRGRYFTVTGDRYGDVQEIVNVDEQLDWLASSYDLAKSAPVIDGHGVSQDLPMLERASKYLAKMEAAISGSGGHNACFRAACHLVLGFNLSADDAFALLWNEYNPRCSPRVVRT